MLIAFDLPDLNYIADGKCEELRLKQFMKLYTCIYIFFFIFFLEIFVVILQLY